MASTSAGHPPTSYGILLFPGFELLDVAGPLNCLNTLSRNPDGKNLTLSIIGRPSTPSDPSSSPQDITPAAPNPAIGGRKFLSQQIYRPTHTFATAPPLDVLIVPGGFGTRDPKYNCKHELQFIEKTVREGNVKYVFTVCTGSLLAAAAGVLDGHKATTNKAAWETVTEYGRKTHWVAKARWVRSVKSSKETEIWTTSGVSAGMDGMLAFLQHVYGQKGPEIAEGIARTMEYEWQRDSERDPFCEINGCVDVPPRE